MNRVILTALLLAGAAAARAQTISVGVRPATDFFLLYEAIEVEVSLHNHATGSVELQATEAHPWLRFLITDPHGRAVLELASLDEEHVLIGGRQTIRRSINLLPLYDLREPGEYHVQAIVETDGTRAASRPVTITIAKGAELWAETVELSPPPGAPRQTRTYSLVVKRERYRDTLYAGVADDAHQRVYGVLPLGQYVALGRPEAQVDDAGQLHTLWRLSPRQFGYAVIDPFATFVDRAIYADLTTIPRLVGDPDGNVRVQGGEKTHPRSERVLRAEDLQPPEPPPPPPPKRWWQFWKRSPPRRGRATPGSATRPPGNPRGIAGPGSPPRHPRS